MKFLPVCLFVVICLFVSLNCVQAENTPDGSHTSNVNENETSEKNRYYNIVLRRRSHTTKEFYAYVDKIRGMHMDPNKPKFRAEVVRVLLNMKLITVKNPSKAALKYFEKQRDVVDTVTEELKDIEAEL